MIVSKQSQDGTLTLLGSGHHMLTRVWQQLEFHIDVCRVTRGAHIKHL
jgi:hypothetical protein